MGQLLGLLLDVHTLPCSTCLAFLDNLHPRTSIGCVRSLPTVVTRRATTPFQVPQPVQHHDCDIGSRSYYYQGDRGHRELPGPTRGTRTTPCFICGVSQGRWTGQWDARVASKHSDHQSPNKCRRAALSTEMQLRNPFSPDALRSGTLHNTTDMCDVSNRGRKHEGQRRLATEHEQSAAHSEDDDRRDPQLEDTKVAVGECRQTHDRYQQRYLCRLQRRCNQSAHTRNRRFEHYGPHG